MDPLYKPGVPLGWAKERIEETLDRGLIAIKSDKGVYLGWRLLKSDPADVAFNVYRGIDEAHREAAAHDDGFRRHERRRRMAISRWTVAAVVNGRELPASERRADSRRPPEHDQVEGGRERCRSRRHWRSQRRRHVRLRGEASGRSRRSGPADAEPRLVQDRRLRWPLGTDSSGGSISAGTSSSGSGFRRWWCAIWMGMAKRKYVCARRRTRRRASRRFPTTARI